MKAFNKLFSPPANRPAIVPVKRRGTGASWFWILFGIGIPVIGLAGASRVEAMAMLFVWQALFGLLWFALAFYFPERARSISVFWAHVADAVQRFQAQRAQSAYMVEE